ncbi:glutamine-hydrolyzing GMP synthase [Eubacteriales bacterium OttesenSCG-928-N13]|nr:glutamine-hydrolyzing GMP synthase [Eubacteriales bacterium OttesenSCG-928-N13]
MYQNGILVLEMGGGEARSITRKVRGERVFAEVLPFDAPIERMLERQPKGIILCGDDRDAFAPGAPDLAAEVYQLGLPMLGLGNGARLLMRHAGAQLRTTEKQPGTLPVAFDGQSRLFIDLEHSERVVDRLDEYQLPEGFRVTATIKDGRGVAFEDVERGLYAVQFYPETNDPDGLAILNHFAIDVCGADDDWTAENIMNRAVEQIRNNVGDRRALTAISGGVDSAVCAALMFRAIGDQLHCLHVDTGLMRLGEREQVEEYFAEHGMNLTVVDARARFLQRLKGITDNELKHRIVYAEYEHVLLEASRDLGTFDLLVQGTIYNDVLDGETPYGVAHMNGEEQPKSLLEPIRMLFKDEVRDLGTALGLPDTLVCRQPFPSAGLAVRCVGEVTEEKLVMVREADNIFRDEIKSAGLDKRIRQYFAVLTDVVTGGTPDRGYTVALRAVNMSGTQVSAFRLSYDVLERIVERITKEVRGVNRVVYDVTGQPPASVEWD